MKNLYLDKVPELDGTQQVSDNSSDDESPEELVQTLPRKKQGRPLLIGKELQKEVQEYIKHMRKASSVVNTEVVSAAAEGILVNHDSKSSIKLSTSWAMRATTSGKESIENLEKFFVGH